ncbi:hypothetical protein Tco_0917155, partial [Tanacetum coccineum]
MVAVMKHMASNFAKLDKFEGVNFRRWQKKMHFMFSRNEVCVMCRTTPIPKDGGDDCTENNSEKGQVGRMMNYVGRGLIVNGMSDSLFDICTHKLEIYPKNYGIPWRSNIWLRMHQNPNTTAATTTRTAVIRPKAKGLVIQEQEQASTTITSSKDKGKGIMVEEPLNMKKKDQDKVETDYELAQRLQAEEQKELTIEEKYKLFQQLLEKRRKHFAAKRAKEKRNRPPTKAQQRSIMCTYMKNMTGWKPKDLKTKSFANVQELFEKAMKRQKVDNDKETKELKQCMEIVSDDGDDVTIEATPLSIKSQTIMLKNFDRVDLEVLWSIVKTRFKKIEPVNNMDIFLHLNLKTMFEHYLEDSVWKNQQGLVKVLNWKLYDSCGVHCVTMHNVLYYLLVEKMYPLTKYTLYQMFNDVKLQVDYECEMSFELLR